MPQALLLNNANKEVLQRLALRDHRDELALGAADGVNHRGDHVAARIIGHHPAGDHLRFLREIRDLARCLFRESFCGDLDALRGQEVVQPAHALQLAAVENRDAVADALHIREVVRAEEHRLPALAQLEDDVAHLALGNRVEAGSGLVQQKNLGVVHERLSNAHALEHAAGVFAQAAPPGMCHADQLQEFPDALIEDASLQAEEAPVEPEELLGGEEVVEVGAVWDKGEVIFDRCVPDLLAEDPGPAGGGEDQPQENLDGGGLPGPVGAEESEDLAFLHLESEILEGHSYARAGDAHELFGETLRLDGICHALPPPCSHGGTGWRP